MASTTKKQDDSGIYNLTVGTEVSAKYRGAFCEAKIKSLKKNVQYKVVSKKTAKSCQLSEDNIKGVLKIGILVEAQFPDQSVWQECTIQSVRDRSLYTVVFDDGDERTLNRASLCLKGDRHFAKSETLDNLPLTDPENFGTPVLGNKKNRRRRPTEDEYEDESEDRKTHDHETAQVKKKRHKSNEQETSSEDDEDNNEKRKRWLADPLMGKVVIVEPNDKRKHWFPGLVVNPLCYESHQDLTSGHLVVRSFKTGKFLRVSRASVKEMTPVTIPAKLDSVWKGVVEDAQGWQKTRTVSDRWRMDIKEILDDSDDDDDEKSDEEVKCKKKEEKKLCRESEEDVREKVEEKKNHDFLEVLYKFMDDHGTPINKTPVLGYKDLDLFLLFNLVQGRHGSLSISSMEWKQIYLDLGILKPNPAAGHNVRTAYAKYLGAYEEYCASWKHIPISKKFTTVKTSTLLGNKEKMKLKAAKNTEDGSKALQEPRKIKVKDNLQRIKSLESGIDSKTKGRSSPPTVVSTADSPAFSQQRRSGKRRRVSESSSASDVTLPPSSSKVEKKTTAKGNQLKKPDEKFRSPGGPDSEPDENSRSMKTEKKEAGDKRPPPKLSTDSAAAKRIRRNSTSSVFMQYSTGDKLKVKYGQGKTSKLYEAKVLQLKLPDGPGEAIQYLVHYAGWNARYDEWIKHCRIVGLAEDKGFVASSPTAGTAKPTTRRPRIPIGTKDDIIPLSGLSYSLSFRFRSNIDDLSHLKDDLPDLPIKHRVPSLQKKNLVGDLMKSLSSPNTVDTETKRPTSPVLISSQRTKQSKMTPVSEPVPKPSKPTSETQIKKDDTASRVADNSGSIDIKENLDSGADKKLTNIVDEISEEEKPKLPASAASPASVVDSKTDVEVKLNNDDRERSVSPNEESVLSIGEAIEDNANEQRVGTPVQQVRRTSRRSKSPAYLTESAWFSKRKKYSTASVEKSPSPSPAADRKEVQQKQDPAEDSLAVTPQRTSSPTPSTQSSTSLSSSEEINSNSKDASLVLSIVAAKISKTTTKTRTKVQDEIESNTNQQEVKNTPDGGKQKPDNSQSTEYDNFDDEAPSIALEKHHETEQPATEINEEREQPGAGTSKSDSPPIANEDKQRNFETSTKPELPASNVRDSGENRRKIRKRKPLTAEDESLVKDEAEQTQKAKDDELISTNEEDTVTEFEQKQPTQSQETKNEIESNEMANTSEAPSSSNHDNMDTPHGIPSPPENPPSSSKVLLENTPPSTPEQSPNYISEDQDIEPGKSSPNLYSDDMNGEEHKDSAGNTSSSGCEHVTSSDKGTHSQAKDGRGDEDDKEETSNLLSRKKRRSSSRKRTTSKCRDNRRSSYINDQDTESEDDQDAETTETNRRKSHESSGRSKPRKKRTKVRPEPPTAPPPLPMEKLESMTQDERIEFLQSRMAEMRTVYHQLKQEVANIDRKRKRAKRREREAAEAAQLLSKSGPSSLMPTKDASSAARKEDAMMALLACTAADVQAITECVSKPEGIGKSTQ